MIKRIQFFVSFLLLCFLSCDAQVFSKRKAPKEVTPVIVNNIKYTAPTDQMGYVVASDLATDSIIWKKQIYVIRYNTMLEKDVQDVFIDSLYVRRNRLMIQTERGKTYSLQIKQ